MSIGSDSLFTSSDSGVKPGVRGGGGGDGGWRVIDINLRVNWQPEGSMLDKLCGLASVYTPLFTGWGCMGALLNMYLRPCIIYFTFSTNCKAVTVLYNHLYENFVHDPFYVHCIQSFIIRESISKGRESEKRNDHTVHPLTKSRNISRQSKILEIPPLPTAIRYIRIYIRYTNVFS